MNAFTVKRRHQPQTQQWQAQAETENTAESYTVRFDRPRGRQSAIETQCLCPATPPTPESMGRHPGRHPGRRHHVVSRMTPHRPFCTPQHRSSTGITPRCRRARLVTITSPYGPLTSQRSQLPVFCVASSDTKNNSPKTLNLRHHSCHVHRAHMRVGARFRTSRAERLGQKFRKNPRPAIACPYRAS